MRRFTSYGPVDPRFDFCVERQALVEQLMAQLVGAPNEGGHFFTLWGPRQTGKTWLMRRVIAEIRARYGERFAVGALSMQALLRQNDSEEVFLRAVPRMFRDAFSFTTTTPVDWEGWRHLFDKPGGAFDKPLILLIDEFDALPPAVIDQVVSEFRRIYLDRDSYVLHGLALVGVRAVLGVDSTHGSPFNVQRSLHVPNFTRDEVTELFAQYQAESGQPVVPEVVAKVFEVTRGQPGLVSWFGELLTLTHNTDLTQPITLARWDQVYAAACHVEPNNTILNLLQKAKQHVTQVAQLFTRSDVPFSFGQPWCNFLYMHGVIDHEQTSEGGSSHRYVCRFSSPFVQHRLYTDLAYEMELDRRVPVVDPHDDLTDVFSRLDLPALLGRYRGYLERLDQQGINPWHGQVRRADLHLAEAAGHFHLYWWLVEVTKRQLVVSPEFPTGNGKVDLYVSNGKDAGVIEVKSFTQRSDLPSQKAQAARYAVSRGLPAATLAMFVPTGDEALLRELSGQESIDGVVVTTVAIGAA
jgi:AAA-like domain